MKPWVQTPSHQKPNNHILICLTIGILHLTINSWRHVNLCSLSYNAWHNARHRVDAYCIFANDEKMHSLLLKWLLDHKPKRRKGTATGEIRLPECKDELLYFLFWHSLSKAAALLKTLKMRHTCQQISAAWQISWLIPVKPTEGCSWTQRIPLTEQRAAALNVYVHAVRHSTVSKWSMQSSEKWGGEGVLRCRMGVVAIFWSKPEKSGLLLLIFPCLVDHLMSLLTVSHRAGHAKCPVSPWQGHTHLHAQVGGGRRKELFCVLDHEISYMEKLTRSQNLNCWYIHNEAYCIVLEGRVNDWWGLFLTRGAH
jgi:hypothetical protein